MGKTKHTSYDAVTAELWMRCLTPPDQWDSHRKEYLDGYEGVDNDDDDSGMSSDTTIRGDVVQMLVRSQKAIDKKKKRNEKKKKKKSGEKNK